MTNSSCIKISKVKRTGRDSKNRPTTNEYRDRIAERQLNADWGDDQEETHISKVILSFHDLAGNTGILKNQIYINQVARIEPQLSESWANTDYLQIIKTYNYWTKILSPRNLARILLAVVTSDLKQFRIRIRVDPQKICLLDPDPAACKFVPSVKSQGFFLKANHNKNRYREKDMAQLAKYGMWGTDCTKCKSSYLLSIFLKDP